MLVAAWTQAPSDQVEDLSAGHAAIQACEGAARSWGEVLPVAKGRDGGTSPKALASGQGPGEGIWGRPQNESMAKLGQELRVLIPNATPPTGDSELKSFALGTH